MFSKQNCTLLAVDADVGALVAAGVVGDFDVDVDEGRLDVDVVGLVVVV